MAISRTDLQALIAAPDLRAFDDLGGVLNGMRYVANKLEKARTIEVTADPYEFLSLMVKLMKYAEPGVYALVAMKEDVVPEEIP